MGMGMVWWAGRYGPCIGNEPRPRATDMEPKGCASERGRPRADAPCVAAEQSPWPCLQLAYFRRDSDRKISRESTV